MSAATAQASGARLLRATVAYDGTDFSGFQIQVGQRTVQGELEQALARITQTETRVIVYCASVAACVSSVIVPMGKRGILTTDGKKERDKAWPE